MISHNLLSWVIIIVMLAVFLLDIALYIKIDKIDSKIGEITGILNDYSIIIEE